MTTSLFKDIESLNKDIDNCKGKIDCNSNKTKNHCPPNCYCDKRIAIDQRNYITTTRKKTASAKVTKTDLNPSYHQPKESKLTDNLRIEKIRPKSASVDSYKKNTEHVHCGNFKKDLCAMQQVTGKCSRADFNCDLVEPVKLPKKNVKPKKEQSWGSLLQQNNGIIDMKENYNYYDYVPRKDGCTQMNSSPSSSVLSQYPLETQPIYVKNKGIQCDDKYISQDKLVYNSEPLNTIQYLITNMKSKLKNDPSLGSMLDEMEVVLRRMPFDRGDSKDIGIAARNSKLRKFLHPRPHFAEHNLHPSYEEIMNLEATYLELEATCARLKNERNAAVEKAVQKSAELVESMRREVETKSKLTETNLKIKEMSGKLETYTKSMEGLTEHVKRLQNENKDLERIRGQVAQLSVMMRDVTQENKNLLADLQLVTIDRNKLEVALALKEKELEKKAKNLSGSLLEKSKTNRSSVEMKQRNSRTYSPGKLQTSRNDPQTDNLQFVASSPNSSSSESILREGLKSWVAFSRITPEDDISSEQEYALLPQFNKKKSKKKSEAIEITELSQNSIEQTPKLESVPVFKSSLTHENLERRPDLNKIDKLKEEIRRMFTEMRELAKDVPPMPDVSSMADSSDLNWTELSHSCESFSEFNSSDYDFMKQDGNKH